ncbi:MAG: polyprenyl synthetase family protein [Thermoplasmata archaeon]|nr:polyprenyl synthetase family protein [Thermoplasmata archaeon]
MGGLPGAPGGVALDPAAFEAYLRDTSKEVDAELHTWLPEANGIPHLHEGVRYALGLDVTERKRRGKRLRPALCLLACESLGGDPRRAMPFALASEMLHNFMLVHDDIEDGDRVRRGRDAVWVRYGLEHAINIGDYMFAQTYDLVHASGERGVPADQVLRLVDIISGTVKRTGEGQALELGARLRRDLSVDDYLDIVRAKTGRYLAAPLLGGAEVAGADPEVLRALASLGDQIGPVFQIADDVLDLSMSKGRGEPGSDIREGKRSLLVVHTAAAATSQEAAELFRILDTPREQVTDDEVTWVMNLFEKYEAVEAAKGVAREMQTAAEGVLRALPDPLRANLSTAVAFMLGRKW